MTISLRGFLLQLHQCQVESELEDPMPLYAYWMMMVRIQYVVHNMSTQFAFLH